MSRNSFPVVIANSPQLQNIWGWLYDQAVAQGVNPEDQNAGTFTVRDLTKKNDIQTLAAVGAATMAVTPNGVEVQLLFDQPGAGGNVDPGGNIIADPNVEAAAHPTTFA